MKEEKRLGLIGVLAQDPRPAYQNNPEKIYVMDFAEYEIKFSVHEDTLTVKNIVKNGEK